MGVYTPAVLLLKGLRSVLELYEVASHIAAIAVHATAIKIHPLAEVCAPSNCDWLRAMKFAANVTINVLL
jgi:hypothetical protein